ncbi:unnamed protein product [Symbiodinium sp. CCMP2592]|nr:unnamed protein product [Symbiodinium sp. CCMP2592]
MSSLAQEVWGGGTLAEKLNAAFVEFKAFCHDRKIICSQPKFLPKMLARNGDTEFTGKAYNAARLQARVMIAWIANTAALQLYKPDYAGDELMTSIAECTFLG